jgi:hypothetical protein
MTQGTTERARGSVAAPLTPGLDVAVGAALCGMSDVDAVAVHVRVRGGDGPIRLFLYFDGELVETWTERVGRWEFRPAHVAPARHAVTARAIDARGRWGGASTIVDTTFLLGAPPD